MDLNREQGHELKNSKETFYNVIGTTEILEEGVYEKNSFCKP